MEQTELRSDLRYIQYYILVTNFIFMGIIPSLIMIIFNVLVVRAVNEANQKRARMTRRQQRNITVTSMLVSGLIYYCFLIEESKLFYCFPKIERNGHLSSKCVITLSLKSILPLASVWGKTILNTGGVGGAELQT